MTALVAGHPDSPPPPMPPQPRGIPHRPGPCGPREAVSAKAKYAFPTETLKTQADVLRFAAGLEKGAVSAYLGAIPRFADRELSRAAGSILGDEAMHWAILRNAVGETPVPSAFVS